ncbi:S-adenosyl-L-methionine-dependent methyltransferase [Pseudovirgaria hyperparasitica]|uniref:tRNA (adenine(58)-N(1))-methyltransferase catalytic subunit TRM61 n=1 Tax=Pseudovirgaria hyperparasitica TaxID=470096 RepID=A0A6A6W5Q7_9PEZI|nr:S-adenosyl-L-methionine-dependent methyltransferase [Pseudovirgaria hyperparasitica]KAF2756391.1 S-adenosyl-L-methionine-dependent methyltransferase [Pseudovirgaria hyperparasitica]
MAFTLCTRQSGVYSFCRNVLPLNFRRHATGGNVFADGDTVLLKYFRRGQDDAEVLVKLRKGGEVHTGRGRTYHNELIGKSPRDHLKSSSGSRIRVMEPTLADYCRLTPRLCTPIYPWSANTIVSALDIHLPEIGDSETPPLEILESGTGHGSLTLHLARAIHGANPPRPRVPSSSTPERNMEDATYNGHSADDVFEHTMSEWKKNRRAVIHTVDNRPNHAKRGKEIVRGFRRGLYADNVEFHVSDVSSWITREQERRESEEPFLSHVVLDMPSAQAHLSTIARALRVDGVLAIFNPSITQIGDCEKRIRLEALPLTQDQVIELVSPRPWDLTCTVPRSIRPREYPSTQTSAVETETVDVPTEELCTEESVTPETENAGDRSAQSVMNAERVEPDSVMICRPKFYTGNTGGGFLGVWRRMHLRTVEEMTKTQG